MNGEYTMQAIEIEKMENVYGIKKLVVNVDNSKTFFQDIIYSPNGIFKTSFSKCLYELSNGNESEIKDRISNKPAKIKLNLINGKIVESNLKNKFIVFSREIYEKHYKRLSDYEEELRLLTLRQEDKNYVEDLIYGNIEELFIELRMLAKKMEINFDKTIELLSDKNKSFLDNIINILQSIDDAPKIELTQVKLKNIFQRHYDFIDDINFKEKVQNYIDIVNARIKEELFDDKFDENACLSFLAEIKKDGFLNKEKHRGLIIKGKHYYDIKDVENLFQSTISKIIEDPNVLEANRKLLKAIGDTKGADRIKKEIINNPILINELFFGRRQIILISFKNEEFPAKDWINILQKTKQEVIRVLNQMKKYKSDFEVAIEIYKKRFHPTFDIKLIDKPESMLGLQVPHLLFKHKSNSDYELVEDKLYEILSSGEKTALNVVKFIVEYNYNKKNNPIVILDDIVETFDYRHRYAFIEYINDIVNNGVSIIVLTHNFEFYKTLSSRVHKLRQLVASVDKRGTVYIQKNHNISKGIKNIFNITNKESLYYAIPYLRQLKIMLGDETSILTACLHYKSITKDIKLKDVLKYFPKDKNRLTIDGEQLYIEGLREQADKINKFDSYDLAKKTILSICCRVFLEAKIIQDNVFIVENISYNQLKYINEKYKNQLNENVVQLIEKVQLATPEFIHGNTFMYEPLVDIPGEDLKKIYKEICELDNNKIWKKCCCKNNPEKTNEPVTIVE